MSLAVELPLQPYPDEPSYEDSTVFTALHREFFDRLVRVCTRQLRDRSMAEDIAQDTMLRAMRYWTCYDTERPSWPWLKAIALRKCADAHRARTREVCLSDLPERAELRDSTEAVLDEITLRGAMEGLPERQRLALALRYIDDRNRVESAQMLGLNVNAFDQLLARARVRLATVMEPARAGAPFAIALVPLRFLRRLLPKRGRGGLASAAIGTAATLPLAMTPLLIIVGGSAPSVPNGPTAASHTFNTGVAFVRTAPTVPVRKAPATAARTNGRSNNAAGSKGAVPPVIAHASVSRHPLDPGRMEEHKVAIETQYGTLWVIGYTDRSPGSSVVCSLKVVDCTQPT